MNDKKSEWCADVAVELKLSVLTPCRTTHLLMEDKRLKGLVALRDVILNFFVWDKFCKFLLDCFLLGETVERERYY